MVLKATISKVKKNGVVAIIFLFVISAFAPSINANIQLEAPDEISTIIQQDEDCGCLEQNIIQWNYPVICTILYPIFWIGVSLLILGLPADWVYTVGDIARELNCWWGRESVKMLDTLPQMELIKDGNEIKQETNELENLPCGCENDNITVWNYPGICTLLYPLVVVLWGLVFIPWLVFDYHPEFLHSLLIKWGEIGIELNCWWA